VLQILITGPEGDASSEQRARAIWDELREGVDFARLARERSQDHESAARGGQYAIFERGTEDSLLKAAAFELAVGEASRPIRSPLGWHLLKRVEESAVDPQLRENNWARLRGILIRHASAQGAPPSMVRDEAQAQKLAQELAERVKKGED